MGNGRDTFKRDMTSIKINYTVTIEDLVAFNEDYFLNSAILQKRFRKERLFVLASFLIGGLIFAFLALIDNPNSSSRYLFSIFICFLCLAPGLLIYAFIPRSTKNTIKTRAKKAFSEGKNTTLLGYQELVLDAKAITVRNEYFESSYTWEALEKMSLTANHIFVYISVGSAIVIPKQSIDKEQLQAVESFLEEKLGAQSV